MYDLLYINHIFERMILVHVKKSNNYFCLMLSVLLLLSVFPAIAGAEEVESTHHYLPANSETVRWGNIGAGTPTLKVKSGDTITVETITHHSGDDHELMIDGDHGVEDIFHWTETEKHVERGPGVHVLTGPIHVEGAVEGDILEVRILDMQLRPSSNPLYEGKTFGVNAAANWGYLYNEMLEEPKPREIITVYEMDSTADTDWASAYYSYMWEPMTDPDGVVHETIDYPGVVVDQDKVVKNFKVLDGVRVPVRLHFGTMGVAPKEADIVDSVPPSYFGGNIDDWRIGTGTSMFYPVSVDGALLSIGDPHAGQGDSELAGTAIETSITGEIQVIIHKKEDISPILTDLNFPLLETEDEWVIHGFSYANYLEELGENAQKDIYQKSSIDLAMKDATYKTRWFLMNSLGLTEDEAYSLMSVAVDFGITQVVDGNWGVHATINKAMFEEMNANLIFVRQIFENDISATVEWDEVTKSATVKKDDVEMILTVGSKTIVINGETLELSKEVQISNSKMMVTKEALQLFKAKME